MCRVVFLILATYGEGEPTITASTFVSYVTDMGDSTHQKGPLQVRTFSRILGLDGAIKIGKNDLVLQSHLSNEKEQVKWPDAVGREWYSTS